ncbi:MAG: PilZ domain-containing protein [Thermodesulfobacteriota bacterium]|nr:PilZ domain-containing protein [Thermodesulfobacteriota bacterium]
MLIVISNIPFLNFPYEVSISIPSKKKIRENAVKIKKELRKEPRKLFEGPIFYATEDQLYEGEVKNYSISGVFVKTNDNFFVGQWLNLALPFSTEKNSKCLGAVVWKNTEGIGVELKIEKKL